RIAELESLALLGVAGAVAVLTPIVASTPADLAAAALRGLGLIDHQEALPPLLGSLRSQHALQRIEALRAMGERGGPDVVDAMQWVAAADVDPEVVQAAIEGLARIATPQAIETLINLASAAQRREACVAALAQLGTPHIELIGGGLHHAQTSVRLAIIETLSRIKRPRASEFLVEGLDDAAPEVRMAAVHALARLGSR